MMTANKTTATERAALITKGDWNKIKGLCRLISSEINVSGVGVSAVLVEWDNLTKAQEMTLNHILDSVLDLRNRNSELQLTDVVNFNNKLVTTNQHITLLEALWGGEVTCWETNSGYINYKGLVVLFELQYPNIKCYYNSHWIDVPMEIVGGGEQ